MEQMEDSLSIPQQGFKYLPPPPSNPLPSEGPPFVCEVFEQRPHRPIAKSSLNHTQAPHVHTCCRIPWPPMLILIIFCYDKTVCGTLVPQ